MTLILDGPSDSGTASSAAPERIFLENLPTIDALIQIVARRHRLSPADAEEFASMVRLRLIEQDYGVIRKFRGGSSLRTYLTVVIARLCLDFRAASWGRWRPSQGARRLGPVAVALERLMVRDGLSFDEACASLPPGDAEVDQAQLREFAERFPVRSKRRWVEIDTIEEAAIVAAQPDESGLKERSITSALARALKNLDPADRRLLKLRFTGDMSISNIARREGIDQGSLYRRVAILLRRMRRDLALAGIDALPY
jgi:RNA polymerase sigma factor (sigma-70 family)